MKLIKPYYIIEDELDGTGILKKVEKAGRTCYKSENRINENSHMDLVKLLISLGHESVLEHEKITIRFICDRGVSHELVRHRIASFSQESTRYCNYGKDEHIQFIIPCWFTEEEVELCKSYAKAGDDDEIDYPDNVLVGTWLTQMTEVEKVYNFMVKKGWSPQQARSVLPNSLKTEIVITANLREWRTILKQRTSKAAHPQMRELMIPLLSELKNKIPLIFDDINP